MTLALLVVLPALFGVVALLVKDLRLSLAVLLTVTAFHLVTTGLLWSGLSSTRFSFLLELDATGRLFLTITSALFLLAALYTVPYLLHGTHDPQSAPHRFVPCLLWFLSATTLVTVTTHLAVLWTAVEATTLASAPLVYFYRRKGALEAAWKYLLICSVGIALALLGTFFLGVAASTSAPSTSGLTLSALQALGPSLDKDWLRAAFVLALVGYGTKMGLAPLHTWLPDAHSQAPSPVSALLSGTLLNAAFLSILRFYQVCLAADEAVFARTLFLALGFVSIAVACAFMIGQRDYKRLLAYSSVENMGVLAVGMGVGGGAVFGSMLHAVNHSLCKAGLFFLAGNVLRAYGTTGAADVRGLLRRLPGTGVLLTILFLAIGGVPPFGPFFSEFLIFQFAMERGTGVGVLFIALLAVAFLGMAGVLLPMLQGRDPSPTESSPEPRLALVTPLLAGGGVLLLGLYLPPFLSDALREAAALLGG